MNYRKDIKIEDNTYTITFDSSLIDGYQPIIFQLNGNCCGKWSDFNEEVINQLCKSVIDYIIENKPEKFCFYSINSNFYNFYKSYEYRLPEDQRKLYNCREENLKNPFINSIKVSFYDRI